MISCTNCKTHVNIREISATPVSMLHCFGCNSSPNQGAVATSPKVYTTKKVYTSEPEYQKFCAGMSKCLEANNGQGPIISFHRVTPNTYYVSIQADWAAIVPHNDPGRFYVKPTVIVDTH